MWAPGPEANRSVGAVSLVGAPSSFLFLVAMPAAPSSVLAPSSDALCSARRFRPRLENRRLPATKFGSVRGCRDSSMLPRHSLKIPASACSCKSNRSTISIWSMTDSESFTWKWKTTTCLVGGISWRSAGNGGAEPHHWKEAFISEWFGCLPFFFDPSIYRSHLENVEQHLGWNFLCF